MSDETRRSRLLELLRSRSFARKKVTLASGRESDFFIDVKQTALTAEGHALVGQLMFEMIAATWKPDAIAGVELGGCSLASAVSLVSFTSGSPLDALYVRKEAKDHGSKRLIEGDTHMATGASIAIVEDVTTTGGSAIRAASHLREAGYTVCGVLSLVDRMEGGAEALAAAQIPFRALYTRLDFIPG